MVKLIMRSQYEANAGILELRPASTAENLQDI